MHIVVLPYWAKYRFTPAFNYKLNITMTIEIGDGLDKASLTCMK